MPDLTVTVPLEKTQLVRDMVEHRDNTPRTDPEMIEYVEWMLTQQLKRWCQEQQQAELNGTFVFDDPVP